MDFGPLFDNLARDLLITAVVLLGVGFAAGYATCYVLTNATVKQAAPPPAGEEG